MGGTAVERTVDLDGIQLAVLEAGVGGRPLLLVHGFTGCKEDFADEVPRLAGRGFHVVAPDLRGHGSSSKPAAEAAYGIGAFVTDILGVVSLLGWSRFDLLGHSMGGMIAQEIVVAHPERVDRLVLMDTHHGQIEHLDLSLAPLGQELARTKGLEVIQVMLEGMAEPGDTDAFERVCAERPGYRQWARDKVLRCSSAMYASMIGELSAMADRLDRLAAISQPTLVMVGGLDRGFRSASRRLADTIPDARLVVFEQAGHCPQFEATDEWRRSLDEFLERGRDG